MNQLNFVTLNGYERRVGAAREQLFKRTQHQGERRAKLMTCIRKESGFGSINFGQRFGTLPFCRIGAHVGQTGADLAGQQIDEFPIDIVKRTIGIESNDDGAHRLRLTLLRYRYYKRHPWSVIPSAGR